MPNIERWFQIISCISCYFSTPVPLQVNCWSWSKQTYSSLEGPCILGMTSPTREQSPERDASDSANRLISLIAQFWLAELWLAFMLDVQTILGVSKVCCIADLQICGVKAYAFQSISCWCRCMPARLHLHVLSQSSKIGPLMAIPHRDGAESSTRITFFCIGEESWMKCRRCQPMRKKLQVCLLLFFIKIIHVYWCFGEHTWRSITAEWRNDYRTAKLRSSKAEIVWTGCWSPAVFISPNVNFFFLYRLSFTVMYRRKLWGLGQQETS